MLEASRSVIELFLRRRTSAFSVKELAQHAGLAERTFYRYFPRKEDAIRPYIDAWLERIVCEVRAAPPSRPLREAMVAAHATAFAVGSTTQWEALLPVLNETESLRAVWLQVVTDAEAAFAQLVAERLEIPAGSLQARMAAAVLSAAGRLAMERAHLPQEQRDPGALFAESLALVGPGLFEKRRSVRRAAPAPKKRR